MVLAHEIRNEGHQRHPEEQVHIQPQQSRVDLAGCVHEMVMIHPHNGNHQKAQQVAQETGSNLQKGTQSWFACVLNSRIIMVTIMAITPSLKASTRPLPIPVLSIGSPNGKRAVVASCSEACPIPRRDRRNKCRRRRDRETGQRGYREQPDHWDR
jgi:hypothetical protein